MFDSLKTDETIKTSGDTLGGSKYSTLESALYDFTVKLAYGSISKGGAKALNLLLETDDGKELKQQLWMSSGKAKGCLNYYMSKNPKTGNKDMKKYLPGFEAANHLTQMCLGKEINQVNPETKTIMLYDFSQGKEVPTEVPMITELINKKITAGVIKKVENKRTLDADTGKYVATTETREINEIDKFFHYPTGLTVTEAQAKADKPVFKEKWAEKWTGVTKDNTESDIALAPSKKSSTAASNTPREGASLFGGAAA